MPENIVTQKVGPLPLVAWVAGGAGLIFVIIMIAGKNSSNSSSTQQNATNQVSSLAPTEAEAFGTMEQQQQDVTNALATIGNNQSALGGSLSTLTGIVTQQGTDNAAAFQNLVNGQNTIQQGQTSAATQANNYYASLLQNIQNYGNSLGGQLGSLSQQDLSYYQQLANQAQAGQAANQSYANWLASMVNSVSGQVQGVSGQVAGVSQQVQGVSGQVSAAQATAGGTQADVDALGRFLGWEFYQLPNRYSAYIPGQSPGNYGGTPIGML